MRDWLGFGLFLLLAVAILVVVFLVLRMTATCHEYPGVTCTGKQI